MGAFELDETKDLIGRIFRILHLIILLFKVFVVQPKVHLMVDFRIKPAKLSLRVMYIFKGWFIEHPPYNKHCQFTASFTVTEGDCPQFYLTETTEPDSISFFLLSCE